MKSLRWVSFGNMPRLLDEHLIEFLKCHPDLREFRMRNGGSPPACLAKYCRKLSILQLDWTHPSPPGLKFNRRFFTSVFPELKRLRRLYVAFNKYFDDSALRSVCNSCPQLEVLLMGSTKVSAGQLLSLSQLTSLKTLDISHIDDHQNVTDTVLMAVAEALGDNLEHLWITDYNNITDMSLIHLARFCPNLEKLVVDHCSKITTDGLVSYLSSMVRHPSWESQRQRILSVSAKGSKIEVNFLSPKNPASLQFSL